MTAVRPERTIGVRAALTDRRFVRHYLEMLAAMFVGMAVLAPPWWLLGAPGGVEADAFAMATSISVGMSAWMLYRRHSSPAVAEMAAAMYLSFAVLLVSYWAGVPSADGVLLVGHVIMLPVMAVAMLHRRAEYTGAHE